MGISTVCSLTVCVDPMFKLFADSRPLIHPADSSLGLGVWVRVGELTDANQQITSVWLYATSLQALV